MSACRSITDQEVRGVTLCARIRLRFLARLKGGAGFPDSEQGVRGAELPFFKVKHLSEADADGCLRFSEHTVSRDTAAQLGACPAAGTVLVSNVTACAFRYIPALNTRNGALEISLELTQNNETVRLYQEMMVSNVP